MTHPLADMPDRPPGRGPSGTAATGEPSLSMQQRTVLERLITRLVALTSQQNAEVWACVKHDLGLKGDSPLLACHFSAAEASLNQRLAAAQDNHHHRQTLAQLSDLLGQGNNRQAVSDYIRQHYGQTALHAPQPDAAGDHSASAAAWPAVDPSSRSSARRPCARCCQPSIIRSISW